MNCNRKTLIVAFVLAVLLFAGCSAPAASVASGRQAGDKQAFSADNVTFSMIFVPGKKFLSNVGDSKTHEIAYDYWIGETEVTYQLWLTVYAWAIAHGFVIDDTATIGSDDAGSLQQPVTNVSWFQALVWCNAATEWYNEKKGTSYECVYQYVGGGIIRNANNVTETNLVFNSTAQGFRLPFEDESELAARYKADLNDDGDILDEGEYYPWNYASGATDNYTNQAATHTVAVYDTSSSEPVASRTPNALGMYDATGNVLEWCSDIYLPSGILYSSSCLADNYYTCVGRSSVYSANGALSTLGLRLARTNTIIIYIVEL
jgi:formylglycine-generating enzyme required for sulfatase activity